MKKILLVEDDKKMLEVMRRYMENRGFSVIFTDNGSEALILARDATPDLIVADVGLPGLDGLGLCKAVKSFPQTSAIPIIIISGDRTEEGDIVAGYDKGADDYLTKPFEIPELLARVRAQLRIRELQEKLRDADKLAVIGQAAIALSDRINSPLSSIIWQARLLQGDLKMVQNVPRNIIESLDSIVYEANRIERVLKNLHEIKKLNFTLYDEHNIMLDLDKSVQEEEGEE